MWNTENTNPAEYLHKRLFLMSGMLWSIKKRMSHSAISFPTWMGTDFMSISKECSFNFVKESCISVYCCNWGSSEIVRNSSQALYGRGNVSCCGAGLITWQIAFIRTLVIITLNYNTIFVHIWHIQRVTSCLMPE